MEQDPMQQELWQSLNIGRHNSDPGGGILYALRYSRDELSSHQFKVAESLQANGVTIRERGNELVVDFSKLDEEKIENNAYLLEELAVVNEALEYVEAGVDPMSIADFADSVQKSYYMDLVIDGQKELPRLFEMVEYAIPEIIGNIYTAERQNRVLKQGETEILQKLGEFAAIQADKLNNGGIVVIGSTSN